jgi:hypothetical protein
LDAASPHLATGPDTRCLLALVETLRVPRWAPLRAALPAGNPLVTADPALEPDFGLADLETGWPVERLNDAPFYWMGQGATEGVGVWTVCLAPTELEVVAEVAAAHGRPDKLRHLVLTVDDEQTWADRLDGAGTLRVPLELPPGAHYVRLYCTDEATIKPQPNGDTRNLLVGVYRVAFEPPAVAHDRPAPRPADRTARP